MTNSINVENHLLHHGYLIDAFFQCKKDHKCNACEKEFSPASMFKSHIKSINNGQKDKCDTCGKRFRYQGQDIMICKDPH